MSRHKERTSSENIMDHCIKERERERREREREERERERDRDRYRENGMDRE